ncbi:MAG: cation:proton antiporter [Pseudomonadota bacterium]|nr:cation:proton antiporter [Pseudomonadota bacterium]
MHVDPIMPILVATVLGILLVGVVAQRLRQPNVIGYLIAGIVLGPHTLQVVSDPQVPERMGAIGVVLLLFFVGMEVSPRKLLSGWTVSVFGTALQIGGSVLAVWLLGLALGWSLSTVVLFGFIVSLSSTAVVLPILQQRNELDTPLGQQVLGVLLVQDLALVPMLILLGALGGEEVHSATLVLQLTGAALIAALITWMFLRERIHIPLPGWIRRDPEMQVFAALVLALGLSLLTGLLQLSTALGAFTAGMLIASAQETDWVHRHLEPFRVVFVAAFFVSIGMLVNPLFLWQNLVQILLLVVAVLLTNTLLNALIFRMLGSDWTQSMYVAALLAQIGEFSFVLAALGFTAGMIDDQGYQLAVAVIALSLLLSPAWIQSVQRHSKRRTKARPNIDPPTDH